MISGAPSLFVWSLSEPRPTGTTSFVEQYADDYWRYGSGKVALYDGLGAVSRAGDNVLVPAYLPDAVVEPFHDRGLEPRFYAVQTDLTPDFDDLQSTIDDRTAAVLSVDYFGFPQPAQDGLAELAADHDCYHVDDSAHSPFSVHDGTLLGTRGDIGVTCLWKQLPIPNGALLYLSNDEVAERFEPGPYEGVNERYDRRDLRYVLSSVASDLLASSTTVKQSVDALVAGGHDEAAVAAPGDRYEAAKRPMSKLSQRVIADADPQAIRDRRRENYRTWLTQLEDHPDLRPLYDDLPAGICPQVVPVYADDPDRIRRQLADAGVGDVHTWPRLSETVLEDPAYETAARLSRHVVTLPVHQHVDRSEIDDAGRRLTG